ncbi:Glucose--fructose oxidoreductase precursor [Stieleria maiorica]|uniref:Glucose--fructose oxidoreductase n=1 Tax=Stieleria maiorica TaxID=2795974 RepID=A0A5B9MCK0_9BACT|nr:Gfo/Idh/MocA family oxidoreductase [Stieleria maiorica]QEF96957.1 Glucose--fructose oxidoreductase precursor [Stieleria maiorica]
MTSAQCRWGILSTANIARKNWQAIRLSGSGVVRGVSSRSRERAGQFIDECQWDAPFETVPEAFEGHEALLACGDIDAVYVPMPTGVRKEWVIAAAEAKKHVLIEKPVAVNAADAQQMLDACNANGVQLMDGVMFDHGKRIGSVSEQVRSASLGQLRRIQAHFSFTGDSEFQSANIRTDSVLEPHGCLGDLGWYCIRFILWASGFRDPVEVSGRTITPLRRDGSDEWVPGEFAGELVFDGGLTAGFFCSFCTANQQLATLSGDCGYLTIDDFVLPLYDSKTEYQVHRHELEIDNCRWNFRRRSETFACDEYHSGESNAQEVEMMRTFNAIVTAGTLQPALAQRALQTQRILDACRRSDSLGGQRVSLNPSS